MALAALVAKLGTSPSKAELIDIAIKRQRLQARIDRYNSKAEEMWPPAFEIQPNGSSYCHDSTFLYESDEEEVSSWENPRPLAEPGTPEKSSILLPSMIGLAGCRTMGYTELVEQELKLRIGQANDSLQGVRMALSRKAVVFREGIRNATSKVRRGRSWDEILILDGNARHHARVYSRARSCMLELGATPATIKKYRVLSRNDLKIRTNVIDPNARGERNSSLPWFWTLDVKDSSQGHTCMDECEYY